MKRLNWKEAVGVTASVIALMQAAGAGLEWLRTKRATSLPSWIERVLTWWRDLDLVAQVLVSIGVAAILWTLFRFVAWLIRKMRGSAALPLGAGPPDVPGADEQPPPAPEPTPELAGKETPAATLPEPVATPGPFGLGETIEDTAAPARTARAVLVARDLMTAVGFKDREKELGEIGKLVDEGRGVIWVTGPAQSGKSWLESHFARQRGWQTKAARFELRGGADVQAVLEGVNRFLQGCNETRFDPWCRTANAAVAEKAAALCQVLKGGGYVIVLDSFEDVGKDEHWADLVRVMQEDLEGSWVLVGSRIRTDWADRHAEVEVGPMERGAGEELLADAGAPSEGRGELLSAVGGLPGALELAGALAQDRGAKAVADDVKGAAGEVGETLLAETFDAAGEGAQNLWTGLCLLPSPVTPATAEALCQRDDFGDAWQELVRRKLLDPGEERAELHPLARAVGDRRMEKMADWRKICGQRIAKYYADFANAKRDDRDAIEAELENILAAARLAFQYQEWEALWGMGGALGERLDRYGRWAAQRDLFQLCILGAKGAKDRRREAQFVHNFGIALQNQGKLKEAGGLYTQARDAFVEIRDRRSEAAVLHQLGMVAQDRGQLEEAEDFYNQSLEITREVGNGPGQAKTLHQLGMVAQDRGKLEEAEDFYNQSLEIKREVGNRPGEAMTLHQLGNVAYLRRKLEEAEDLYNRSLVIEREVGDRPGEAQTLGQMALLAEKQGDVGLAVERMEKAAAMMEEMGMAEAGKARGVLERLRGARDQRAR